MSNEFDSAVAAALRPDHGQDARFGFSVASDTDPDAYAEARRVARRTGVPVDTVLNMPKEMKRRDTMGSINFDILAKTSPATAALMADIDRAKLAHDDVVSLAEIERTVSGTLGDVGVTALKGAVGLPQAFVGLADIPTFGYAGKALDAAGLRFNETQSILDGLYSPAQQAANRQVRSAEGFGQTLAAALSNPSTILTTVGESLPQMLGGAGIARGLLGLGAKSVAKGMAGPLLPGLLVRKVGERMAPVVAGALGEGVIGAGGAAEQIREKSSDGTLSAFQSAAAIASGAGTAAFSLIGGRLAQKLGFADIDTALASGKLTPGDVNKGFFRTLAEAGLSEGVLEELPQSAQEQIWQNLATDRPVMEGVANAAALGLLAGAATGGAFQGVQHLATRREQSAQRAERSAALLGKLNELAKTSKLAARSPEDFQAFLDRATEGAEVQDVYVSAEVLHQSGVAQALAEVSPAVAEQIEAATATGGLVRIPVSEYAATIARTEFSQTLLDHLKVDPDGYSAVEAREYVDQQGEILQGEVEQVLRTAVGDAQTKAEVEAVRDDIRGQLEATGRFRPEVNDLYAGVHAAFAASMAQRAGMPVGEFWQQHRVKVVSEPVVGGQALKQFAGGGSATADTHALDGARQRLDAGDDAETVRRDTGWSKGVDGAWRYEISDADAALLPALKVLRKGAIDAKPIARVTYRKREDGTFDLTLAPPAPKNTADFVVLEGVSESAARAVLPDEVFDAVNRGDGVDDLIGNLEDAKTVDASFNFDGMNALPLDEVLDHPALFSAYPALRDFMVEVDPKLGNSAVFLTTEAGDKVIRVGSGQQRTALLHEIQHGIQAIEGFASGGSPTDSVSQYASELSAELEAALMNSPELERAYTRFAQAQATLDDVDFDPVEVEEAEQALTALPGGAEVLDLFGTLDGLTDPGATPAVMRDRYRRLAGEVEARNTQARADLTDEQRAATPIEATADTPSDRVIVVYNGAEMASSPPPANAAAMVQRTGTVAAGSVASITGEEIAPRDTDIKTLRAKTKEWYAGNLKGKLVTNKGSGRKVLFRSANKAFSTSANPVKLRLFAALHDLVVSGQIVNSAPPVDPAMEQNVKAYHWLEGEVALDGQVQRVGVTLREDDKGNLYYNHNPIPGGNEQGLQAEDRAAPAHKAGGVSSAETLDQSVDQNGGDLNLRILDQPALGTYVPDTNTIALLKDANLSTFLHETGHYFLETTLDMAAQPGAPISLVRDAEILLRWFGVGDLATWANLGFEERRSYHEKFARGFEAYLYEGKASSVEMAGAFQRFRSWLVAVYKSIKALNVELTPEVRGVMDRLLATDEQIEQAEQNRSMVSLFASPESFPGTADEWAKYQADTAGAPDEAKAEFQARALRDMRLMHNARGREMRRLDAERRDARHDATIDARREVMREPVYRAWEFLTRKIRPEDRIARAERAKSNPNEVDETRDSLFVAIAKLGGVDRAQLESEWGLDAKERPSAAVFGKPVVRREKGLTLDRMGELLAEQGYLETDDAGKWNPADFEEKFFNELRGAPEYSLQADYGSLFGAEEKAGSAINLDSMLSGRLDKLALQDMYGVGAQEAAELSERRMVADNGIDPDIVARHFGFESGHELVGALIKAQPPRDAINGLADRLMLERHGEMATPEVIAAAADAAAHNVIRQRVVVAEEAALAKAVGRAPVVREAARMLAAEIIGRTEIRHLKPAQFAAAAARAGRAADKAMRGDDLVTAAAEKRNQLFSTLAARLAHEAREQAERDRRYLRKFDKRIKALDSEYQDRIVEMLGGYDLTPRTLSDADRALRLREWVDKRRAEGVEPDIDPALYGSGTFWKNLSVEQFRGLVDAVRSIEHLGRFKNKLLVAKDRREFRAIADEVAGTIVAHGGSVKDLPPGGRSDARKWLDGFMASHRKLGSLVRQMSGGQDGGTFWNVFLRPLNEAGTWETTRTAEATAALAEVYKPMLELPGGLNGRRSKVEVKAMGGHHMTRTERLAVALNAGNEANLQRLMDGGGRDGLSAAQIDAVLGSLSSAELKFVNRMWAYLDSFWPEIAAKQKRVTGVEPEKVEARPFEVVSSDGVRVAMRGGYYPIKYDADKSSKTEAQDAAQIAEEMKRGAFTSSTTRRGHTKARQEAVGRALRRDLDVITEHVAQVIHDLAWHETLIDTTRLLRDTAVEDAVRDHYGPDTLRTMKDALDGIAVGDLARQTTVDRAMLHLRANVSRATMGFSLRTALLQPFGLTQSMVRIGPRWVMRGLSRWAGDAVRMDSSLTKIREKSPFMAHRAQTFNRELHEIKNRVSKGHGKAREVYDASLFMLMQKMQLIADVPTWWGAYEKAMSESADEATAVALADQAVLDAQGGGQSKDLAEVQRKHPFLTMFYSYFNTTWNLTVESTARTEFRNPVAVAGWLTDMTLLHVIPAIGPALVIEAMQGGGGDDDFEDWVAKLAEWQVSYLLGTLVGVRELGSLVGGFDYAGPPVGRVLVDFGGVVTQAKQGEADEQLMIATARLTGSALGLPSTQLVRSYRGWQAWEEGDAPPTAILMGPPPRH